MSSFVTELEIGIHENIVFIHKPFNVLLFGKVKKMMKPKSFIAPDIARLTGDTLVAGTEKDLENFRKSSSFIEFKKNLSLNLQEEGCSPQIADWLVNGDVGLSSLNLFKNSSIFKNIHGSYFKRLTETDPDSCPKDYSDWRRCVLFSIRFPQTVGAWETMDESWKKFYQAFMDFQKNYKSTDDIEKVMEKTYQESFKEKE